MKPITTVKRAIKELSKIFTYVDTDFEMSKINKDNFIAQATTLINLENELGILSTFSETGLYIDYGLQSAAAIDIVKNKPQEISFLYNEKTVTAKKLDLEMQFIANEDNLMPCSKEHLSVYHTVHEYGHLVQHSLYLRYLEKVGWKSKQSIAYSENWYLERILENAVSNYEDIIEIAIDIDDEFNYRDCISEYVKGKYKEIDGRSIKKVISYYNEMFAECFANAYCGKENTLGKAMKIFLKNKKLLS